MTLPTDDWRLKIGGATLLVILAGCAGGPKPKGPQPARPVTTTPSTPAGSPSTPPPAALSRSDAGPALVPLPSLIEPRVGEGFHVTSKTLVVTRSPGAEVARIASVLGEFCRRASGTRPVVRADGVQPDAVGEGGLIQLEIDAQSGLGSEGYDLTIASDGVRLTAAAPAGLFYGVQTLRQLLPSSSEYEALLFQRPPTVTLPPLHIRDAPRYAWRGAMLDVARHFFTVAEVKRYVDLLALQKLNRLHLHLADDQGWRIEIKKWPDLTAKGGATEVGGTPGGFYTQAQYADLVAYAGERFITVVPEIDMPGHTNAALASYAELNCTGKAPAVFTGTDVGFSALCVDMDFTYIFISDVVKELAALTPGPYFHMGGDEVKTLTPPQYRAFVERVQSIVQSHGKEMIGWDEVAATTLLPTSIVQHWRPDASKNELSRAPHLILSPGNRTYLDMKYDRDTALGLSWAGLIPVRTAYDWEPSAVVPDAPAAAILGIEAPLWSETTATMSDVEFLAMPRLAAIAEVAWSPAATRDWERFRVRLGAQAPRWAALGINFYRAPEIPWR